MNPEEIPFRLFFHRIKNLRYRKMPLVFIIILYKKPTVRSQFAPTVVHIYEANIRKVPNCLQISEAFYKPTHQKYNLEAAYSNQHKPQKLKKVIYHDKWAKKGLKSYLNVLLIQGLFQKYFLSVDKLQFPHKVFNKRTQQGKKKGLLS